MSETSKPAIVRSSSLMPIKVHVEPCWQLSTRTTGDTVTDEATLKSIILLEEYKTYCELYNLIESGYKIQPHEMAIIKSPYYKRTLIDLIIQRQISRI